MASPSEGYGLNPGLHICIFRNSFVKLHVKFTTRFTLKENIIRTPAQLRSTSIMDVNFQIRPGPAVFMLREKRPVIAQQWELYRLG